MRKIFILVMVLILLVGCSNTPTKENNTHSYISGVWLSYSELDTMLTGDFKAEFDSVVNNCKKYDITDMFVHVRPFGDSYYPSKIFPIRLSVTTQNFDVLQYMITICHKNAINFHAWVNPYRIKTADADVSTLSDEHPVKIWLTDQDESNDTNVSFFDGIYLNPASAQAQALVVDGVREIIDNYNIDGIHFDDYFYPTTDVSFDQESYTTYCSNTQKPLALGDFRRANINALISSVYTAIKFKNKDIIFSVSPSASIEENFNRHYADVVAWIQSSCVDYIIPQIYFGFNYPDDEFRFENLISKWQEQLKGSDVKLLIGLASYKINTKKEPDCQEWADGKNVINRQIEICKTTDDISGHVCFSYTSMREYLL